MYSLKPSNLVLHLNDTGGLIERVPQRFGYGTSLLNRDVGTGIFEFVCDPDSASCLFIGSSQIEGVNFWSCDRKCVA